MDTPSTPSPPNAHPETSPRTTVSAVVVAGDAGATIARTLTSVLGQTLPPDRVVVVVAGSRDDTFAVARTFNGRHEHAQPGDGATSTTVTVIDRGPREGTLLSAYDLALRLAGGEGRVLIVSPDAELEPPVLELLCGALDRDPDAVSVSARLDPQPSGSRGPLAGALRLLQRHWAMGAVETGIDLGFTGPVPLAPATLVRLDAGDPRSPSSAAPVDAILPVLLAGDDRSALVVDARARVDTAVTWGTMRQRRDRWGAYVARLTRGTSPADAGDRRRARLASLRIGVGPVLRVVSYALAALYLAAAGIQGLLEPAWWWAVPVLVRLPLQIRTLRRIRERTLADVVFGATHLPLEAGEAAYGIARIRDGLHRMARRSRRVPTAPDTVPPFSAVDAVAAGVLGVIVVAVLALSAVGGPAAEGLATAVGVAAVLVTAADLVMALLRLLVARGGPFARPRAGATRAGGTAA
ncbi:glycosyltransferase family A protein [Clavibacter capsici]|uniref:Glycosyltransferase family 2 protein n=1 Tax=Clavibacter capsici TaxID=1874630 RepID=A0AAE7CBT7_9MICO|nr:glycosyltransferase family A protein [Clavibacter capsici]ALD11901.1 glycosyl transferase [Clavibacter capsici]QIS43980.1 glycosyltransferase family 2 protein [Clavibacter capsici]